MDALGTDLESEIRDLRVEAKVCRKEAEERRKLGHTCYRDASWLDRTAAEKDAEADRLVRQMVELDADAAITESRNEERARAAATVPAEEDSQ